MLTPGGHFQFYIILGNSPSNTLLNNDSEVAMLLAELLSGVPVGIE